MQHTPSHYPQIIHGITSFPLLTVVFAKSSSMVSKSPVLQTQDQSQQLMPLSYLEHQTLIVRLVPSMHTNMLE